MPVVWFKAGGQQDVSLRKADFQKCAVQGILNVHGDV